MELLSPVAIMRLGGKRATKLEQKNLLILWQAEFSRRNEMAHHTWTERVIARLAQTKALNGRDRLRAALGALGFPLN